MQPNKDPNVHLVAYQTTEQLFGPLFHKANLAHVHYKLDKQLVHTSLEYLIKLMTLTLVKQYPEHHVAFTVMQSSHSSLSTAIVILVSSQL